MANNKTQAVFKSSVPRVKTATQEELEWAAEALTRHTHIRVDERLNQITGITSKYGDEEFFDAYKLAAERKGSAEIAKELALVLTDGFGMAYISPRHFNVEELEGIIVDMCYAEMAKLERRHER